MLLTYALTLAILVLAVATAMGKRYSIAGAGKLLYRLDSFTGEVDVCRTRYVERGYVEHEVVCGVPDRVARPVVTEGRTPAPTDAEGSPSDAAYDAIFKQMHAEYMRTHK